MLSAILFAAIAVLLIWATLKGRDAFPFSHYPMFSSLADLSRVEVFRIELQTLDGNVYWWKSRFYRYPEFVGRQMRESYYAGSEPKQQVLFLLGRERYLREVLRLIEMEEGTSEHLQSFRIIKRTVAESATGDLSVKDEVIETIPISSMMKTS